MIKIEKTDVSGWEAAIRGMRNPMNSWDRSDSEFCHTDGEYHDILGNTGPSMEDSGTFVLGPNDRDLMMRLAGAGPVDAKFRRMIVVYTDITAPLYWWKEFDTYKVGTVANSCSTMHKISEKEFTIEDFSHEHLTFFGRTLLESTIKTLNDYRDIFNIPDDKWDMEIMQAMGLKRKKDAWWQMIQLLPSSYNQKRTIMLNYEVLSGIFSKRRGHKLDEWREFCGWIEKLPYSEIITGHIKDAKKR